MSPDNGPFAGGNTVTVTNGSFGTVTNVLVGSVDVPPASSGLNWFIMVMPPATNAGPVDITIQTSDNGETTLAGAYTYNPAGAINSSSGDWVNLAEGVNGEVRALATDGTNLYVGGYFTMAGGQTANRIAYWDGSSWHSMGDGMNGVVHAFLYTGGKLYVGGSFSSADGLLANKIAVWDGTTWGTFGNGFNDTVLALAHDGTTLYASGYFTYAASTAIDRIARWNGSAWSGIGGGLSDYGSALAFGNGHLFVGGDFTTKPAGCHSIAMWNGSSWNSMNGGLSNIVQALVHDGENLYAGGNFSRVASRVGMWDGTSWTSPGGGVSGGNVSSLLKVGDDLYVGGGFTEAGGEAVNRMARWNGTSWTNVGSGMNNGGVRALAFNDGILYAGGSFTNAGGKAASRIAQFVLNQAPGVDPASGAMAGGYPVTIIGTNLSNGGDITNVTLCGVPATIVSQSSTQVVVTAGASLLAGLGDVRIFSTSFGETMRSDAFTYEGRGLRVLGTNDVAVVSGEAPSEVKGTGLPLTRVGMTPTLDLRIENTGTELLTIDRADVTGSDRFTVEGLPATVAVGGISPFTVRFSPDVAGVYTGAVALVSDADGAVSNYVINLSGTAYGITTNIGPFAGGNTITITIGDFGTITNVVVGDLVDRVDIVGSGDNWVTVVLPPATNAGTVDITIQTSDNGDFVIPSAYTYNPPPQIGWSVVDTSAWQEVQRYPRPIHSAAAAVWNDVLYVMGGYDSVANANGTNVYRKSACGYWEQVAGLPAARHASSAAVFQDALYFAGGLFSGVSRTNVYRYNGTTWTEVAGLPAARHYGGLAVLGDHLYYVGGRSGSSWVSTVYRFDGTNWTTATSLPAARAGFGCAVYDGKIHVIGGYSGSATTTNVYVFDGTSWTQTAGLPLATDGHAAAVYDGKIYTVGGNGRTQSFVYDGTSWTEGPGLPAQRPRVAAATFGDQIHAVGGDLSGSQFNVYRYPARDEHTGVFPPAISYTGGYSVVISGSNLTDPSDPADLLSVTLCGVPVASVDSVSATQIVVTAAAGASQRGDVVVQSVSYGTATGSNIFHYAPWTELDFDFGAADWQSTNISMVGNAYWPNATGWDTKRLRLTSSVTWQRGNGWVKSHRINPSRDWVAAWRCSFSFPNPADNPADGVSFNIHTNDVDYHPTMNEQLGKNEASVLTVNVHMFSPDWRGLRVFANGSLLGGARMDGLRIDRDGEYPIAVTARYDSVRCELHVSLHQPATDLGTNMIFKIDLGEAIGEEAIGTFGFSGRTGATGQNNDVLDFNIQADMGAAEMAVLDTEDNLVASGSTVDFGTILYGTVTSKTFAITNAGVYALVMDEAGLTGSADFVVEGLPSVVEGGSISNFTVTLNATNFGSQAATLILTPAVLAPYVLEFDATVTAPPVVGPVTVWRTTNQLLKVPDFMLLTNSVDPQSLAMSVVWVSAASTNGGTVALEGRWITYEPPPGDDTPDAFNFRVRNAHGLETEGTAEVLVFVSAPEGATLNVSSVEVVGQDVRVRFAGIPGRAYDVQMTTDLVSGVWTTVGDIVIGALGYAEFIEEDVPSGSRYYRTVRPE